MFTLLALEQFNNNLNGSKGYPKKAKFGTFSTYLGLFDHFLKAFGSF